MARCVALTDSANRRKVTGGMARLGGDSTTTISLYSTQTGHGVLVNSLRQAIGCWDAPFKPLAVPRRHSAASLDPPPCALLLPANDVAGRHPQRLDFQLARQAAQIRLNLYPAYHRTEAWMTPNAQLKLGTWRLGRVD